MKKALILLFTAIMAAACEQQVVYDVDFNVTLDKENTYYVGEPVKFDLTGSVDNLVFYSGEQGAEYRYKDRFTLPTSLIKEAQLEMKVHWRYGEHTVAPEEGLEIYISNRFGGLSGNDGEADRALIRQMYEGGMQGWTRIPHSDQDYKKDEDHVITLPLNDYVDNLSIAFRWNPQWTAEKQNSHRTYRVKGDVNLSYEGFEPIEIALKEMNFIPVIMNGDKEAYQKDQKPNADGSIVMTDVNYDILFKGIDGKNENYQRRIDAWNILQPTALNKVENDKGVVIKNLQNYLQPSYEYTYTKPGTYTATFVGINSNYEDASKDIIEYTVTIIDKPIAE